MYTKCLFTNLPPRLVSGASKDRIMLRPPRTLEPPSIDNDETGRQPEGKVLASPALAARILFSCLAPASWGGCGRIGAALRCCGLLFLAAGVAVLSSLPAVAYPPAGIDAFDSSAIVVFDLRSSGGPELTVTLVGPTRIERSDPFDPGDGKLVIEAEMVSMVLRGNTTLGPITIRESPLRQSPGRITQQTAGTDFPADSFFDIFVEAETPVGLLRNDDPIRLQSVINDLPPFQAEYIPEATFVGVDLLNAEGVKVGVLKHASHFVGQRPSFSIAPGGPSGLDPADIFDVPTAPAIPAAALGLTAADNLDALSYGVDIIANHMALAFSVDPFAAGVPGSDVGREAAKAPSEAHGDEFGIITAISGTNRQILDETGDTAPPFPLLISDDVDALTEPPTSFVDPDGDGTPDFPIFFSLSVGSPTLPAIGGGPGDVLVKEPGAALRVFAPAVDLGLVPGDDLDALCLDNSTAAFLFSLAPGEDVRNSVETSGPPGPLVYAARA